MTLLSHFNTARYVTSVAELARLDDPRLALVPEVAFVGRNMLDQHYYANALDLGPSQDFIVTPGDPAVFGVQVSAKF